MVCSDDRDRDSDSIAGYERHAAEFLRRRDNSTVGVRVANEWAKTLKPHSEVIEIACGGGIPITKVLSDAGLRIWAIDASPTMVATFTKRFPALPVQCAAVLESDFFGKRFDAAISIGLLFLLREEDQLRVLERIASILRPEGRFLFTAPIEAGSWRDATTGQTCLSLGRDAYEFALRQSGFRIVGYDEDSGKNNYYDAVVQT